MHIRFAPCGRRPRTILAALAALAAAGPAPLPALAQSAPQTDSVDQALRDLRAADRTAAWSDGAHHRDRVDAVPGYPEFAEEESAIRSALDAGLAEGWLDRDDFLIFGRQLHQTELREARALRLYGPDLSRDDRAEIRGELDELHGQLDETRGQMAENRGQR